MHRNNEVEYCNVEIRFDRKQVHDLIRQLIEEGYSLYWNESDREVVISIRTGRKLLKLRLERQDERFKLVGDYRVEDGRLANLLEKMIGDSKGHAIVKRFRNRQVLIENIMYGELIRLVEVSGMEHRILYQKSSQITVEDMMEAFRSNRAEQRAAVLRYEIDYELAVLHDALQSGNTEQAEASKERLEKLRIEMLQLEI